MHCKFSGAVINGSGSWLRGSTMGGVGLEIELRDSDKEFSWFSSCEELHGVGSFMCLLGFAFTDISLTGSFNPNLKMSK